MEDKTTSLTDTSEYKITESEAPALPTGTAAEEQSAQEAVSGIETTPAPSSKFNLKNIDWKRMTTPLIIVFSILFVYAIFSFYSAQKNRASERQKMVMQKSVPMVQQQPAAESMPVQPVISAGISSDQMTQMQTSIQQKIEGISQQITGGQDRISGLNDEISKTKDDIASVSLKVEQLATSMQQVLVTLEKMKRTPKVAKKKVSKPPVAYPIRAIVPGRVWLESANGGSITLREGDQLEGYGVVQTISPRQGMVIMSNGSIIQYGINDF